MLRKVDLEYIDILVRQSPSDSRILHRRFSGLWNLDQGVLVHFRLKVETETYDANILRWVIKEWPFRYRPHEASSSVHLRLTSNENSWPKFHETWVDNSPYVLRH